jgi:hypothetical protein
MEWPLTNKLKKTALHFNIVDDESLLSDKKFRFFAAPQNDRLNLIFYKEGLVGGFTANQPLLISLNN